MESRLRLGDGCETRWLRFGPLEADISILALHMLGLDAGSFEGMADALAPTMVLHAYDQRGHGAAAHYAPEGFAQWVEDAEVALARIKAPAVHLVGSSMGGAVAAVLASRQEEGRIASLTLMATPPRGIPLFAQRATATQQGTLEDVVRTTLERWFGADSPPAVVERARRSLHAMTAHGFDASWRALAEFGGYDTIGDTLPPCLCLAFGEDRSTPPADLDEIARQIREAGGRAERTDIPGTGHGGLLEKPQQTAHAVGAFILGQFLDSEGRFGG